MEEHGQQLAQAVQAYDVLYRQFSGYQEKHQHCAEVLEAFEQTQAALNSTQKALRDNEHAAVALEACRSEKLELQKALVEMASSASALEDERANVVVDVVSLRGEVTTLRDELTEANAQRADLAHEIQALQTDVKRLLLAVAEGEVRIAALTDSERDAQEAARLAREREHTAALARTGAEARRDVVVELLKGIHDRHSAELTSVQARARKELEAVEAEWHHRTGALQDELTRQLEAAAAHKRESDGFQSDHERLQREVEHLRSSLANTRGDADATAMQLRSELKSVKDALVAVSAEL